MKRITLILATAFIFYSVVANAQIATIDASNIIQTTISAEQSVTQTKQQIQQFQAQLQQLQNQIQNTANPSTFQWDNANNIINQVLGNMNTLNYYQNKTGTMSAYLSQYSNASQYHTTSCIGTGGCTGAQIQQINTSQYTGSDSQKTANDNMMLGLNAQQQQLQSDASNLATLQQNAQDSTGQMQAIQAGNQIASNQDMQLMDIRSLMIAQQTAEATRAETVVDREGQQQASSDAFIGTQPATSAPYDVLGYAGGSR